MRLGYGIDEHGCPFESDYEVARQARLAFNCCQCIPLMESVELQPFTEGPPVEAEYLPPPNEHAKKLDSEAQLMSFVTASDSASTVAEPQVSKAALWGRVNNEPIYKQHIQRRIEAQLLFQRPEERKTKEQELIVREMEEAINNRLIAQTARKQGFVLIGSADGFADELERDAAVAEQYLRSLRFSDNISNAAIESHFRQHREKYVTSERILVEELRIPVEDAKIAQDVLAALTGKTGKGKRALPIRRDELKVVKPRWISKSEFENAGLTKQLNALSRGELSEPIPANNGFRVFRLLAHQRPRTMTIEEASDRVAADIAAERKELAKENMIRFLRNKSNYWGVGCGAHVAKLESPPLPAPASRSSVRR